ncbi:MAG: TRAFs-binding domain-containing protein [Cyclobacteriaceae bacterium]
MIGRVYKDLFMRYSDAGNDILAESNLEKAIDAYKSGFDADWRDAYPGVNLVTLLYIKGENELLEQYLPVVKFAIQQKLKAKRIDYWDVATVGELEVLSGNFEEAKKQYVTAVELIENNEYWMLESSIGNLKMISSTKKNGNDLQPLISALEEILTSYT